MTWTDEQLEGMWLKCRTEAEFRALYENRPENVEKYAREEWLKRTTPPPPPSLDRRVATLEAEVVRLKGKGK